MTLNVLIKNMTNLNFLTLAFVILAIANQKVESLQCYVPGECYLSPTIDVIYHEDYNSCLMESESLNASWFSSVPTGNQHAERCEPLFTGISGGFSSRHF